MAPDGNFVELVRIGDPIEADLLTAFLGNAEIEFIVQNRVGPGMMSQLMPPFLPRNPSRLLPIEPSNGSNDRYLTFASTL